MRTKTLLLAAALGAASLSSSLAQVYSVNAVGYVNQTFTKAGFYILTNPLNNGNNQVGTIISTTAPDNTVIYRFNSTSGFSDAITYVAGVGWFNSQGPATDVMAPGEAFFIGLPTGVTYPVTLTFVGEVPQGNLTHPVTLTANGKLSLIGSQVPVSDGLSKAIMNFPAADNDTIYFFDGATQQYKDAITYVLGQPGSQGSDTGGWRRVLPGFRRHNESRVEPDVHDQQLIQSGISVGGRTKKAR